MTWGEKWRWIHRGNRNYDWQETPGSMRACTVILLINSRLKTENGQSVDISASLVTVSNFRDTFDSVTPASSSTIRESVILFSFSISRRSSRSSYKVIWDWVACLARSGTCHLFSSSSLLQKDWCCWFFTCYCGKMLLLLLLLTV